MQTTAATETAVRKNKPGQGRKPLADDKRMDVVAVRLNQGHSAQFKSLGGAAWLRDRLDGAPNTKVMPMANDAAAQIRALTDALELEQTKARLANNRITELLAVIKTHETTHKMLSTKLANATALLKVTDKELERARLEVAKHDKKWI